MEKKSVYLGGKFIEKDKIKGKYFVALCCKIIICLDSYQQECY